MGEVSRSARVARFLTVYDVSFETLATIYIYDCAMWQFWHYSQRTLSSATSVKKIVNSVIRVKMDRCQKTLCTVCTCANQNLAQRKLYIMPRFRIEICAQCLFWVSPVNVFTCDGLSIQCTTCQIDTCHQNCFCAPCVLSERRAEKDRAVCATILCRAKSVKEHFVYREDAGPNVASSGCHQN